MFEPFHGDHPDVWRHQILLYKNNTIIVTLDDSILLDLPLKVVTQYRN